MGALVSENADNVLSVSKAPTSDRIGLLPAPFFIETSGKIDQAKFRVSKSDDGHEVNFIEGEKWSRIIYPLEKQKIDPKRRKITLKAYQAADGHASVEWVSLLTSKNKHQYIFLGRSEKNLKLRPGSNEIEIAVPTSFDLASDVNIFLGMQISSFPTTIGTRGIAYARTESASQVTQNPAVLKLPVTAKTSAKAAPTATATAVERVLPPLASIAVPAKAASPVSQKKAQAGMVGFVNVKNAKNSVGGWIADKANPASRITLAFEIDGAPAGTTVASLSRPDLAPKGLGGVDFGFRFDLPLRWQDGRSHSVRIKVADSGWELPNSPAQIDTLAAEREFKCALESAPRRGITIAGWARSEIEAFNPIRLSILVDGQPIGNVLANLYRTDLERKGVPNPRCGFELTAPGELFDGKPHKIEVVDPITSKIVATKENFLFVSNKTYTNFDEFRRWVYFHREMPAPFNEADKRILAYMDWKADHFEKNWQDNVTKSGREPLVSIIMPTFNRADSISLAIESILKQSYKNWELIIIDDFSTDATQDVIDTYDDKRIRAIKLEQNLGVSAARNVGIKASNGAYIAYLDSDNKMDSRYLSVMIGHLLINKVRSAYCGQYLYKGTFDKPFSVRIGGFNPGLLENRNYIDLNAFIHERKLFTEVGGFNEDLKRFVDWDLIVRYSHVQWPLGVECILSHYLFNQSEGTITTSPGVEIAYQKFYETMAEYVDRRIDLDSGTEGDPGITLYRDRSAERVTRTETVQRSVSVIIPSFNIPNILDCAVQSILQENYPGTEIVIVDNASDSRTIRYLRALEKNNSNVKVKYNRSNEGFSRAVNQGIEMANPANDVIFMNNDAIGTKGWLWHLCEARDRLPEFGLLAPTQYLLPHTRTFNDHQPSARPDRDVEVNVSCHHNNLIINNDRALVDQAVVEASFVPFFLVLIRREMLNDIGGLDEIRGRHYRSDRIYCDALRFDGRAKIGVCYRSRVYHLLQQSTAVLRRENPAAYEVIFNKNAWSDRTARQSPWE